jgi:CBS-domain-containing membrane protein
MKVRDIMTHEAVSCRKDMDIGAAARLMLKGRFGTLPVIDTHAKLAGIITDRDIATAAATRQRNAARLTAITMDGSAACDEFPAPRDEFPPR